MKPDQKRALVIGGIGVAAFAGYVLLRSRSRPTTTGGRLTNYTAQHSAPVGSIRPYTPQSPIVVPAGESIYDPNSQALLNTPAAPQTSPITSLTTPQVSTPAAPQYTVNVNYPATHKTTRMRPRPAKRTVRKPTKAPVKK